MSDMPLQPAGSRSGEEELSRRWREEGLRYAEAVNEFVRRGTSEGWKSVEGEEPRDGRQPMAEAVLEAVRRANDRGEVDGLHGRFPRAHEPFANLIDENRQDLPVVLLLSDGRILLRVGSPYESGHVVLIDEREYATLPQDVITVGRSPNRKFFAVARREGVAIHEGWDGPVSATLSWPTGREGIPEGFEPEPTWVTPIVTRLIPYDSGKRALLINPTGIFVPGESGATRLLPTPEEIVERFTPLGKEHPDDPLRYDLSMEHGALSPDGKWIACGHQSSDHCVFDAESCRLVGEVGPWSEYPDCAVFSRDGTVIAFNSCHLYNGMTIAVPTDLLPGLEMGRDETGERLALLEEGARVHAATSRGDEFIIGDADGYLKAFDLGGGERWQYYLGATAGDMDISVDGRRLVVTTYDGTLCILDLDTGEADPFAIGTATHREVRRWLFLKKEPKPLIW